MIKIDKTGKVQIVIVESREWKLKLIDSLLEVMKSNITSVFVESVECNLLELVKLLNRAEVNEEDEIILTLGCSKNEYKDIIEIYVSDLLFALGAIIPSRTDLETNSPLYCISILIKAMVETEKTCTKTIREAF